VLGVTTNRAFLRWLLEQPDVQAGLTNTELIDKRWRVEDGLPGDAWSAAAGALATHLSENGDSRVGFRLNAPALLRVRIGQEERSVPVDRATPTAAGTWLAPDGGSVVLDVDGEAVHAHVAQPPSVEAAVRLAAHHGQGAEHVTAPMPGSVLTIRVAQGEEVEAGQVLVVLEAMKMENGVPAPAAGRVERILVEPGAQVQRGETLIELA
jgi:biotin carboxyl carrier protein